MSYQNFDLLFVGLALAANGVLGSTIFLSDRKSATNRAFFIFVVSTIPWGILNYFIFQSVSRDIAVWVLRGHVFFAVWYCFFLFRLFYIFPKEEAAFPKIYHIFVLPAVTLVSLLTLTPLVFNKIVSYSLDGGIETVSNGPGIIVFGVTVVSLIAYSVYLLWKKLIRAEGAQKTNFKLLLTGIIITFFLHMTFNFVFPALVNDTRFAPFGSLFIFPFIILTSYAIIRYKLFNIRIAGTALLVFALSVVGFVEIILADSMALAIYRSGILLLILGFGVLLIRGVLREVEQREEISRMAEDVKRAYVIEKKSKEELEKLDKVKDQFLMQVQHDLRTPLTSVMGYIDLLLNGTFGKHTKKTAEILKKLQGLTTGMIRKANNFLDLAQFQLGKSPVFLKPGIGLAGMLEEIKNELDFKAQSKGIYLNFEKPLSEIFISADQEKLKAALFNVADNSVKYTIKGGVTIKISNSQFPISDQSPIPNDQNSKKNVLIIIKDTGIGIPPDKIKTIFETMFSRTSGAEKTAMGIGVGLYLSTQVIKAHNGRVWAESEGEGKGSTFYIELPIGNEVNKNNEAGAAEMTKAT